MAHNHTKALKITNYNTQNIKNTKMHVKNKMSKNNICKDWTIKTISGLCGLFMVLSMFHIIH